MPLFNRRSRSVSAVRPVPQSTATPALMAASQAFTASQSPQQRLSASAAAAALRSMSPAPTPVSQVQTKRMIERQNSGVGRGRPTDTGVQRRSSSASMTERSFRAPSPGRPVSVTGLPKPRLPEPPVPQLPTSYVNIPPIPAKSHRRSVSVDDYQSQRPAQKVPSHPKMRNSMVVQTPPKSIDAASLAARRVASSQSATTLTRGDSNSSVNFSYPGRSRPQSPPPVTSTTPSTFSTPTGSQNNTPAKPKQSTPKLKAQSPTHTTPASVTNISPAEARNIQYEVTQASQASPKRKKKVVDPQMVEGSHLGSGSMGGKPKLTPLAPASLHEPGEEEAEETPRLSAKSGKSTGQGSHFPASPQATQDSDLSDPDANNELVRQKRSQRASGALVKQPSMVKEDWDGEQEEEASSPVEPRFASRAMSPTSNKFKQPAEAANVSRKIDEPTILTKAKKLVVEESSAQRVPSLSPSRSARFSNRLSSDMTQGRKHEPLPRSVSPGKSALKNSPRIVAADLDRTRAGSLTPSESTDLSADDSNLRKKGVHHVTFDKSPSVGYAASNGIPTTPEAPSSQSRESGKKTTGIKDRPISYATLADSDDDDDTMRPRPQLPTFGSVRKSRNDQDLKASPLDNPPKTLERQSPLSSSSASSINGPPTMDTSVSSDHALGMLLSREALAKPTETQTTMTSEPTSGNLPAEVLSKLSTHGTIAPAIAVQPATPITEDEHQAKDQWLVAVPGGFPGHAQPAAIAAPLSANRATTVNHEEALQESVFPTSQTERMPSIQEESDRDSIYSDAAEDLSELEGDGFGSINAIVRSPVTPISPKSRITPPESPTVISGRTKEQATDSRTTSWDDTSARWNHLANSVKTANLQPAAPIVEHQARKKAAPPVMQRQFSESDSDYSPPIRKIKPPREQASVFKKSMRSTPEDAAVNTMRTSGRQNPGQRTSDLKTSSATTSTAMAMAATAPRATSVPAARGSSTLSKKSMRSSAAPSNAPIPTPAVKAVLPPVNNDSDSESSFRKRRRNRSNDTGRYSMRRSMRAEPESVPAPSRPQVRSASPVQRRPFSSASNQTSTLRNSMRGSIDSGTPTLRGQPEAKRSSSLFGRSRQAKSPTRSVNLVGLGKNKATKSRFVTDSDDEPMTVPAIKPFKSRINDSSDEEDLPPVRGIPRRQDRDDSTDLDDSSDEERDRSKTTKKHPLSIALPPPTTASSAEPSSPTSPGTKQKRGFFGRFRKNRSDSIDTQSINGSVLVSSPVINGSSKEAKQLGFKSAAEQEALVAETQRKLEAAKAGGQAASSTVEPAKLSRRMMPPRIMSDSWPLPPKLPGVDDDRPHTADGVEGAAAALAGRSGLDSRQDLGDTPGSKSGTVISQKTGKKKRFPMLRKAFGLKD